MRRTVVAAVVGMLAVVLAAPGAWARPEPEDAVGDVPVAKGDIVTATYSANFTDIFFTGLKGRVTLRQGSNPETTTAWASAQTRLVMHVDTTAGHTGPDLSVSARRVGGVFEADVTDLTSGVPLPLVCDASASFTAPNIYKIVLPADCLPGDATSVRARFRMAWDTPPSGGPVSIDRSPDAGWGPRLTPAP